MRLPHRLGTIAIVLALCLPGEALAEAHDAPIVAFVALASRDDAQVAALTRGLVENGLVPGQTVRLETRFADGSQDQARAHIAELIASGAKVFVAGGSNIARMVQQQSKDAAVVVSSLDSLEVAGIAGTIARPAGNVTGFATQTEELTGKWFELLREIVPDLKRVALITNPQNRNHHNRVVAARKIAEQLGLAILVVEISTETSVEPKMLEARAAGAEAAIHPRDFLFESIRRRPIDATVAARLPSMFDESAFVQLGGLVSYSPDRPDLFRRSATYVAKILAGTRPNALPIQQPIKFELVVNLKAAKALGLTIPPSILVRADEVIE